MKIDHILVTTDLSDEALRPLEPIASLARSLDARITLLHVVEALMMTPHGAPMAPALSAPGLDAEVEEAIAKLEAQRATFTGGVPLGIDVVSGKNTAQAIAEYAEQHGVDLIAISTHGRTGFRHFAVGSVAEAVVRHASVPVLVFPRTKD